MSPSRTPALAGPRRDVFASPIDLILLYHRVADTPSDPQLLAVSPQNFAEQLSALREVFDIVPLGSLCVARCTRPRVAITFDDGYADNLHHAKPLLEAAEAPATVFVASGHTDNGYEFWWDELERLVLTPSQWPAPFELRLGGDSILVDAGSAATYTQGQWTRYRTWDVTAADDPTPRHRLYRTLFDRLRPMADATRRTALDDLGAFGKPRCASESPEIQDPTRRPMSPDELLGIASGGLIEIGSHTVTHPLLAAQSLEEQAFEIHASKRRLEDILGRSVTIFSYPFGTRRDYSPDTVHLVQEAGYELACSNFVPKKATGRSHEATKPRSHEGGRRSDEGEEMKTRRKKGQDDDVAPTSHYGDRFQLPRVLVRDWDGDTLMRRLAEVAAGA
ncbi:MAG: polysaccharide deacetylase family protein [Phycisphaerae bacterium]|nr:polysaccharide deacetylase family protein [Phycisphaerae bacterium]